MTIIDIWILLISFQFKHFFADYILQGKYMLGKFKDSGWELPLLAHSSVHMVFTFILAIIYVPLEYAMIVAIADLMIHFTIDRVKVKLSKGYDSGKHKEFWWLLGWDQMMHHLTHYGIVAYMIYGSSL